MATVRQLLTSAARKMRVVSEGVRTLAPYNEEVGLQLLEGLYQHMMATGDFGRLTDVLVEADYEAKEFERVKDVSVAGVTITLPDTITIESDPCSDEDERVPRDLCPVVIVNRDTATPDNYVYDAMVGDWVPLFSATDEKPTGFTLDSQAPLSQRGTDGLASVLAVAWGAERGVAVSPVTASRSAAFLSAIRQRNVSQRRPVDYSEAFL